MQFQELSDSLHNIKIEMDASVLIVTMNRPEALNALNSEMLDELQRICDYTKRADDVHGMIITGEGRGFVAGADIVQMKPYNSEEGRNYAGYAQETFNKVEELEIPVIAAVNGFALGGGCELALSCDLRVASEAAKFGQPEVTLGIMPCFGGTQRLPRLVGVGVAKDMIYTTRFVDAAEALKIGLVNRVVSGETLMDEAKKLMSRILEVSPIGIKYAKLAINKGADMDLRNALELEKDMVGLCFATEDKARGMEAFLNKEKANFRK